MPLHLAAAGSLCKSVERAGGKAGLTAGEQRQWTLLGQSGIREKKLEPMSVSHHINTMENWYPSLYSPDTVPGLVVGEAGGGDLGTTAVPPHQQRESADHNNVHKLQ